MDKKKSDPMNITPNERKAAQKKKKINDTPSTQQSLNNGNCTTPRIMLSQIQGKENNNLQQGFNTSRNYGQNNSSNITRDKKVVTIDLSKTCKYNEDSYVDMSNYQNIIKTEQNKKSENPFSVGRVARCLPFFGDLNRRKSSKNSLSK